MPACNVLQGIATQSWSNSIDFSVSRRRVWSFYVISSAEGWVLRGNNAQQARIPPSSLRARAMGGFLPIIRNMLYSGEISWLVLSIRMTMHLIVTFCKGAMLAVMR